MPTSTADATPELNSARMSAYADRVRIDSAPWRAGRYARICLFSRPHTIALMMAHGATRKEAEYDLALMEQVEGMPSQQLSIRAMLFEQLSLREMALESATPAQVASLFKAQLDAFTGIRNSPGPESLDEQDPEGIAFATYGELSAPKPPEG